MGKSPGGPGAAGALSQDMAFNLMRQGNKSRKLVFQQLTEGLKTGNIQARIPIIQSQVEQMLGQGSQAVKGTAEQIAKAGGGRSPVEAETMAGVRATAQRAVAAVPSEVIGSTVLGAPSVTQGAAGAAMGLMGTAGGIRAQQASADAQKDAATVGNIGAGIGAAASIAAIIAAI